MIVVLDTNVLISGILWKGVPNKILEIIATRDDIELAQSRETFAEFEKVIQRGKFANILMNRNLDVSRVLASLFTACRFFSISKENRDAVKKGLQIEDPDDLIFIELALESGAQYIISGDPHLLKLKKFDGTDIIKPAEFLEIGLS